MTKLSSLEKQVLKSLILISKKQKTLVDALALLQFKHPSKLMDDTLERSEEIEGRMLGIIESMREF